MPTSGSEDVPNPDYMAMSKEELRSQDDKVPFLLVWFACSGLHLNVLIVLSLIFAYRLPEWAFAPVGLFALLAETALRSVMDYHGQDIIQWPIIILNSVIYGLLLAWIFRTIHRRRRRRIQR